MFSGLVPLLWCEIYPCRVLGRIRGENGERDDDLSPLIPGRARRRQAVEHVTGTQTRYPGIDLVLRSEAKTHL
jgi:hypothetical protein